MIGKVLWIEYGTVWCNCTSWGKNRASWRNSVCEHDFEEGIECERVVMSPF
jgi:hypothetical protein